MFFTPDLLTRRDSGFGLLWYVDLSVLRICLGVLLTISGGWRPRWARSLLSKKYPNAQS
jgi:hypothetical protein